MSRTETAHASADGPYPVRPIGPEEFDRYYLVAQHAFNSGPLSESDRPIVLDRFEYDRSLAALDGTTPVGTAIAYSFRMNVPGGELLPTAGVSWVAVMPTYRRRGVLRSLMRRQLADIRERGEPIAALWASESVIYSRYGYGRASWYLSLTLKRGEGALRPDAGAGLRLRIAEPATALGELAKVYDTVLPARPGLYARNEAWWQSVIYDPAEERAGSSPLRCLLAEDDSGPRGYALYSGVDKWAEFLPENVLTVREMVAADPGASAALWTDLLSRDLTAEFRLERRPVDDPLLCQLTDPRRARPQLNDGLWIRIVDVPAALAGRKYSAPVDVVIEVRDDLLGENAGRWRLTGSSEGAACERVTAEPDLALDVTELGAAYLGGTRLGALAGAGLVRELRPGAVRQLSAAMTWDPAPWCPSVF